MSGNVKEYIFCPYCGGITNPGVCVNCGMPTGGEQPVAETKQESAGVKSQGMNVQSAQGVPYGNAPYNQPGQGSAPYSQPGQGSAPYSQPGQGGTPYGNAPYSQPGQGSTPYAKTPYSQPGQGGTPYGNAPYNQSAQGNAPYGKNNQTNLVYENKKPKKKSSWWIWLLVLGGVLVLGIIAIVVACAILIGSVTASVAVDPPAGTTGSSQTGGTTISSEIEDDDDDVDEDTITVYHRELGRVDLGDCKWNDYASDALVYSDTTDGADDIFLAVDYSSTFGSNHKNYTIDDFSGQYYEPFVDCIDSSQEYGLSRHFMHYSNVHDDVLVNGYIAYIQFEGDVIPNEDEVNRKILEMTANDLWAHLEGIQPYYVTDEEVTFMVDSFVTYNDDEKMSILLDVNIVEYEQLAESYIYAINIDLVNGKIMDNAEILETDVDFATMFREKCCEQNGTDIDGLNYLTDEELSDILSDEGSNIVFFSPYGIEVGYAYETSDYARGWMTITLSDYEQYMK